MARRKSVDLVRNIGVDPRYKQESVQKFINILMWRGKKNTARSIVYEAIETIAQKKNMSEEDALQVFHKALGNVTPIVEVRPRRVGGSVYQVPREVADRRGRALAFRWIKRAAASRSDKTMGKRLANEILEASEGRGGAFRKKTDVHKMAESNRAFSHFSW